MVNKLLSKQKSHSGNNLSKACDLDETCTFKAVMEIRHHFAITAGNNRNLQVYIHMPGHVVRGSQSYANESLTGASSRDLQITFWIRVCSYFGSVFFLHVKLTTYPA